MRCSERSPSPRAARLVAAALTATLAACSGAAPTTDPPASTADDALTRAITLVPLGAPWRYLDDGRDPGPAFRGADFDDRSWRTGRAPLGYGDPGLATTVSYGPRASQKHVTTYFRTSFDVADGTPLRSARLELRRDDGAVVYLNGVEIARSNMPGATIRASTLASRALGGDDETTPEAFDVPVARLAAGRNVLAVEVHQASRSSSDLAFDLRLTATGDDGAAADAGVADAAPPDAAPPPSGDPVFVGAGDIGDCRSSNDSATANLLDGIDGTVFALGDLVYEDGSASEFARCYAPTWGRHKARTFPAPGNHDYHTANATGYFSYFGPRAGDADKGYYSFDVGAWHVVALNSNCDEIGGCGKGSAQERWLRQDLAAHPARCTLAYLHHPRWSSGYHGDDRDVAPLVEALYDLGADVLLAGHDHDYERFAPMDPAGARDDARGLVEFVVGTGGRSLRAFRSPRANSLVRDAKTWGVLKLTLHATSYDFEFVPASGQSFTDVGRGACH